MNVTITSPVTNPRDLFVKVTRVSSMMDEQTRDFHDVLAKVHLNHAIMGTDLFDTTCNDNYLHTPKFTGIRLGCHFTHLFFDCSRHGRFQVILDMRHIEIDIIA